MACELHSRPSRMRSTSSDSTNLDLLRSIAVLCVVANHLWDTAMGKTGRMGSDISWHIGQLGVSMFFVHTALVLMWSLERQKETGVSMFRVFYIRRLFRIYPLSIFCVLFVFLVLPEHWAVPTLLANLSLTQNLVYKPDMIYVLWSLPLEVQMYLLLPFIFLFCRPRPLLWVFVIWVASIPLALAQHALCPRFDVFSYAPNFLGGIIAWKLLRGRVKQLSAWLWIPAIPLVSTVWLVSSRQHNMWYRWAFGLALGLAIPFFADISWHWLRRTAQTIAKYSYGIYLTHTTILWFAFTYLASHNRTVQWTALILLSAAVPVIVYHTIEAPMVALGKRWSKVRRAPASAPKTITIEDACLVPE